MSASPPLLLLLCGLLASAGVRGGQVYSACPDKDVLGQFDPSQFQGLWYEIRRQPNLMEPNSICVTGNVSISADGTISIVNKWYNTANSQRVVLDGTLRRATNSSDDGKLIVKFSYNNIDLDYWILGTDYTNYLVVWSCMQTAETQFTGYAWVLGRAKELGDDGWSAVHAIEERNSIDTNLYEDTRHSDCPSTSS